jgi:dTDP-4-dehydrorhamnose 3,5-epimerase
MPFIATKFPGLVVYEPRVFEDSRGFFYEAYNHRQFYEAGITIDFVQDNQSQSTYGVIRGLHYQRPPFAQSKLIRVLRGAILDIAVDLRTGSPTFGEVFSIELSSANRKQLFIPKGFAHGFSVLSDTAEVFYKCDEYYNRDSESGILFSDPHLAIEWRIPADRAIASEKDLQLPKFNEYGGEFIFNK